MLTSADCLDMSPKCIDREGLKRRRTGLGKGYIDVTKKTLDSIPRKQEHLDFSTGKGFSAYSMEDLCSDSQLYFDPSTGKLTTSPHSAYSMEDCSDDDGEFYSYPRTGRRVTTSPPSAFSMEDLCSDSQLYFDPSTGKLTTSPPSAYSMGKCSDDDSEFCAYPSTGRRAFSMEDYCDGSELYFDPSTGKLTTSPPSAYSMEECSDDDREFCVYPSTGRRAFSMEDYCDDSELYFDPSTGKLTTSPSSAYSMDDDSEFYFDPNTGKLTENRWDDSEINYFDSSTGKLTNSSPTKWSPGLRKLTTKQKCLRPNSSENFLHVVRSGLSGSAPDFYKIQSLQMLGESNNRVYVPIWIAPEGGTEHLNVATSWIKPLRQAINKINYAAPGLHLYVTGDKSKARVEVYGNTDGECYTRGNILEYGSQFTVEIFLDNGETFDKKSTSCHELLHALGIGHEHQRRDRDSFIWVNDEKVTEKWKSQYDGDSDLLGLTRFDPHSIMMYPEDQRLERKNDDIVWYTKPTDDVNTEMSELDKVGLNIVYRPCRGPNYLPTIFGRTKFGNGITGLWYCGR